MRKYNVYQTPQHLMMINTHLNLIFMFLVFNMWHIGFVSFTKRCLQLENWRNKYENQFCRNYYPLYKISRRKRSWNYKFCIVLFSQSSIQ